VDSVLNKTVYQDATERVARQHPELGWLAPIREQALQRFLAEGFPDIGHEDWRYTDLREAAALTQELLSIAATRPDSGSAGTHGGTEDAVHITLVDGAVRQRSSSRITGLSTWSLQDVPEHGRAETLERLALSARDDPSPLTALNAALLRDALLIRVAPGTRLEQPLYVQCVSQPGVAAQTRILVTLGRGSRATLIEHHMSRNAGYANVVTDIRCDEQAALDYAKVQDEHDESIHLASQSFAVAAGAGVTLTHLDLGGKLARNDLRVRLLGPAATVQAHGLFMADRSRHLDNHTRIDHLAPRTVSRELYRGIVDNAGHGVFNGKVIVHPGAAGTDARLTNQNLLLARTAEIDTKPELEIYADDVKCSHGATTGQLDAAALFYLRSRGIDLEDARRLLIAAFAREVIAGLPAGAVTARALQVLGSRLPALAAVGASW
jgi:Fe-S cluster assembly protein SufD